MRFAVSLRRWGGFDEGGEFEDFDLGRAVGPVVTPAHDDVAAGEISSLKAWASAWDDAG
jgi:hypothetical protein